MSPRASLLAALLALSAAAPAAAAESFMVDGNDGYGTSDCLASGGSCGRVVADAWCEAKGWLKAAGYRAATPDDITGSTGPAIAAPQVFVITCEK